MYSRLSIAQAIGLVAIGVSVAIALYGATYKHHTLQPNKKTANKNNVCTPDTHVTENDADILYVSCGGFF